MFLPGLAGLRELEAVSSSALSFGLGGVDGLGGRWVRQANRKSTGEARRIEVHGEV